MWVQTVVLLSYLWFYQCVTGEDNTKQMVVVNQVLRAASRPSGQVILQS